MPIMALDKALSKKACLTLTQLASYDDLVTDALVDSVSPILAQEFLRISFIISWIPSNR